MTVYQIDIEDIKKENAFKKLLKAFGFIEIKPDVFVANETQVAKSGKTPNTEETTDFVLEEKDKKSVRKIVRKRKLISKTKSTEKVEIIKPVAKKTITTKKLK
jgi:hypothetical protein